MNDIADTSIGRPVVPLHTIIREWTRLGCVGFGGPPAHIALLRQMCVEQRKWISTTEFEDAIASVNLLPGPASTQLAIFCAWRLRGTIGAIVGGICFIVPGLVLILVLSAVFLAHHPPHWILGAAAGGGAAVPAVALSAANGFIPGSWKRIGSSTGQRSRWIMYALLGGSAAATTGPYLVLVLFGCGIIEVLIQANRQGPLTTSKPIAAVVTASHTATIGGLGAVAWIAFKVGALSYG
jgi:chromate transporter